MASAGEASPAPEWAELFGAIASGNQDALTELYDAASAAIFGLALWRTGSPDEAGDVVQDVFLRLIELRDTLGGISRPRSWLLSVAHHRAVDSARRRRRRAATPIETIAYLVAPSGDPERSLDALRASRLLGALSAAQREAIYLHQFAGCTFREIARITRVPTFTAASRYRLGLRRLRTLMEGKP
jgi:RNA polymerase sigma-70 factor (ECF subfamily)